ncbi:hypothetical protein ScPMuIL_008618 [Solemya velum]
MEEPTISVNVGGQCHEIDRGIWTKMTESRFSKFHEQSQENGNKSFIAGNVRCFGSVLNHFCGRKLHMPKDVCPQEFEEELQYWGLNTTMVSKCCRGQMTSFYEEQETIAKFDKYTAVNTGQQTMTGKTGLKNCWRQFRSKMWSATENPNSSFGAKVYLALSISMVLLSICVLVISTHRIGQNSLDRGDWVEFIGEDYDDDDWWPDYFSDYENDTLDPTERSSFLNGKYPDVFAVKPSLLVLRDITTVFFAVELFVRFLTCPHKCKFFLSLFNIIDILAVLFAIICTALDYKLPALRYQKSSIHILYTTQILRILRIFRVLRHSVVFQVLLNAVLSSLTEFLTILIFFFIFSLIFSSLSFFAMESNFGSIPDAMWWAIVTMTTVGYGDYVPVTAQGKVIGSLCAITGICLLAILIPIFVNNFLLLKSHVSQMNQPISNSRVENESLDTSMTFGVKMKVRPMSVKSDQAVQ